MGIQVEGRFTFADIWHGTVRAYRKTLITHLVLGVLLSGAGIWLGLKEGKGWHGQSVFLWLGVFWAGYLWPFLAYRSYTTLKRSPNLQGVVRFRFDESGYQLETVHAKAEVQRAALVRWQEGPKTFLLFQNPRIGSVVPKRFFQNAADVDAVRQFLRGSAAK
jgi:YcxB-like protein